MKATYGQQEAVAKPKAKILFWSLTRGSNYLISWTSLLVELNGQVLILDWFLNRILLKDYDLSLNKLFLKRNIL